MVSEIVGAVVGFVADRPVEVGEAVAILILAALGNRYRHLFDAALTVARTTYSALESASAAKGPKNGTADAAKRLVGRAMDDPDAPALAREINDALVAVVDTKKAENGPPLKRWARRALAGQNLTGIAARTAGRAVVRTFLGRRR